MPFPTYHLQKFHSYWKVFIPTYKLKLPSPSPAQGEASPEAGEQAQDRPSPTSQICLTLQIDQPYSQAVVELEAGHGDHGSGLMSPHYYSALPAHTPACLPLPARFLQTLPCLPMPLPCTTLQGSPAHTTAVLPSQPLPCLPFSYLPPPACLSSLPPCRVLPCLPACLPCMPPCLTCLPMPQLPMPLHTGQHACPLACCLGLGHLHVTPACLPSCPLTYTGSPPAVYLTPLYHALHLAYTYLPASHTEFIYIHFTFWDGSVCSWFLPCLPHAAALCPLPCPLPYLT